MDETIVTGLRQLVSPSNPASTPLQLVEFEDEFYDYHLASTENVWIKERRFAGEMRAAEWSAKFLDRCPPQGQPLRFVALTASSKKELHNKLKRHKPSTRFSLKADSFLSITTSRLVVACGDTQCWIESSCRTGGRCFYVSCGMSYVGETAPLDLWRQYFGPFKHLVSAPSKALIFSDIYDSERAADASAFANPAASFRSFNPLIREELVLRTSVAAWTAAWRERVLAVAVDVDLDNMYAPRIEREEQKQLLNGFQQLAAALNRTGADPLEVLHLSPMEVCQRALGAKDPFTLASYHSPLISRFPSRIG